MGRKQDFSTISLFSGAMGLDIGLGQTGRFQLLAVVENNPSCLKTIKLNKERGDLGAELKIYEDIRVTSPYKMLADIGFKRGDVDLIVGGPPCQSFSTAGRRGTIQDQRGSLLWDYLRFVKEIQPSYFLMENVRGLLSAAIRHRPLAKRGSGFPRLAEDEKPGSVLKMLLQDFNRIGYTVNIFEVNAVNYGAPQLRERILLMGNNYNLGTDFPKPKYTAIEKHHNHHITEDKQGSLPFKTLRDAIGGLHEKEPLIMDFSPRKKKYLAKVPPGGNWRALPIDIQKESMGRAYYAKGGRSGWWRRLSYDLPSPCLLTLPNHASTALCHPEEVRALSVKEYSAIQEFPDTWEFAGEVTDMYRQIGNAVPVRLGCVAGEMIASYLDSLSSSSRKRVKPGEKIRPSKKVYLNSHVRTRKWYENGKAVVRNQAVLPGCEVYA